MDKHSQYIHDLHEKLTIALGIRYFLESPKKIEWLLFEWGKVYLRKSIRYLPQHTKMCGRNYPVIEDKEHHRVARKCFDIGTIEILPNYQSQGISKMFIEVAHIMNPFYATFLEEVTHERLVKHLKHQPEWLTDNKTNHYKITENT